MDRDLQRRLLLFVSPLYQDLDGVSRLDEVERVARLARAIHRPAAGDEERAFELLLLLHGLGKWLERVGNISRLVLTVGGVSEPEVRAVAAAIARLQEPQTANERALASALLIDRAGVLGLAQRFAAARREGQSLADVVRAAVADVWIPEWTPPAARELLERRFAARRRLCQELLEEL